MYIFFFFKQKTAYEMRISDWSFRRVLFRSDQVRGDDGGKGWSSLFVPFKRQPWPKRNANMCVRIAAPPPIAGRGNAPIAASGTRWSRKIGRASCRERVCPYV